jgi:hypothetical protein
MKQRQLLWIGCLVAILVGLPVMLRTGYAAFCLLRGEHFYHGLPTSYWATATRRFASSERWLNDHPTWFQEVVGWTGLGGEPAIFSHDPAAVRVLSDLLGDNDEDICTLAATSLGDIGPPANDAVPALLNLARGGPEGLREAAAQTLLKIKPSSGAILPTVL